MKARWFIVAAFAATLGCITATGVLARDRHEHRRFDDHDREVTHRWYEDHRDHLPHEFEAREHWRPAWEGRIRAGLIIAPALRVYVYPPPPALLALLPPPPPRYRYVVIGDHIVLIDDGWHIYDVIHFH